MKHCTACELVVGQMAVVTLTRHERRPTCEFERLNSEATYRGQEPNEGVHLFTHNGPFPCPACGEVLIWHVSPCWGLWVGPVGDAEKAASDPTEVERQA